MKLSTCLESNRPNAASRVPFKQSKFPIISPPRKSCLFTDGYNPPSVILNSTSLTGAKETPRF